MKRLLSVLLICFVFVGTSNATHLMGGEITWECIKSGSEAGKYIFKIKVYRDCQGIPISTSMDLDAHNVPGITSIPLTYIGANDISPTCNIVDGANLSFSCGGVNTQTGNGNGAVEEHVYQSEAIEINGTPDTNGWHFTWSSCCRNSNITNGLADEGFTLRAVMYSYTDSLGQVLPQNNQCHDSSPEFYEEPRTILEVGNGYDPFVFSNGFTYSHNAFDEEQDSLSYTWGMPLDEVGYDYLSPTSTALSFLSPYSYTNPINGIVLNNVTGRTWYPADQQGNFVTCTKVSAFKCGQLVSEIYREIQVVIIPPTCNLGDTTNGNIGADTLCNIRPSVQPPFFYPASPAPYQWDTLAHCGDTITFDFNAIDNDFYPNGSKQDLLFEVSGGQFYDYFNNSPCQNPPCATFSEIGTGASPPFITSGGTGSGVFEWITSCNHIINSCSGLRPSIYSFVIKVSDDFCPAPAIEMTSQIISITVFPPCSNLKIPVVTTDASCSLDNGTAQVSPYGGTPPYSIYWSDLNGIPVNPNNLYSGDYIIRVTDSTHCESIDTITVSQLPITTSNLSSVSVSCNGLSDGAISSIQYGGQGPYIYLWSTGDTTQSISNISAGNYILTVTDINSCISIDSILVDEPATLQAFISNSNGILTGSSSGGTPPYNFEFLSPNGNIDSSYNNFGNSFAITPMSSGNYIFSVIDANGCYDTISTNFVLNFSPTVLVSLSNTYCDSLSDLTIQVSQDSGEVDMSTAIFQSTAGSFDIASMNVGDTIGTSSLIAGGGSIVINTYLMVNAVINSNQAIICANDSVLGCIGSFTINNTTGGGIYVLASSVPDGNNFTLGNYSSATFVDCFINPCSSFSFNSTINSELGDIYYQSSFFTTTSSQLIDKSNIFIHPNPSDGRIVLEMNKVSSGKYNITIIDMLGQKVYDISKHINSSYRDEINISEYGKGTYLITIENSKETISRKLLVE